LVDAGQSGKAIEAGLSAIGIPGERISAILVTHEHSDHIMGVGVLSRRYRIPVYATGNTWRFFERHGSVGRISKELKNIVEPGVRFAVGELEAVGFDIPHDASQPVGYSLFAGGRKATVATDIGCVTDSVRENLRGSDILVLESNHDLEMLKNGRYPQVLKDRIMGSRGHLSNESAGTVLAQIMAPNLKYVFLGHLSEENNMPLLAAGTVEGILMENNINPQLDLKIMLADRHGPSDAALVE
jgi:phosphoribosyl 1,2-cyclic phosphodiesterase